ncbi:hypothetical protein RCL1_002873 [Eukaryota sp. TZLM3-RCL]
MSHLTNFLQSLMNRVESDARREATIHVDVVQEADGVFFEPISNVLKVNISSRHQSVLLMFTTYSLSCMNMLQFFQLDKVYEEVIVNLSVEFRNSEASKGLLDSVLREKHERAVVFKLVQCPCLVAHQQPRCGFFNHPQQVQAST